jgi:transcriptional regulator with XRE-family HTH domain
MGGCIGAMSEASSFGEQLRRFRELAGLSQEELAEQAGITVQAIGMLERGERRSPYPHTVRALAEGLGLDATERATLIAAIPRRSRRTTADLSPPTPSADPPVVTTADTSAATAPAAPRWEPRIWFP